MWLTFYGDDFTGSTDALEQLTLAGIRTTLFIEPPTAAQLRRFPDVQAVGVAGMTRSLAPAAMAKVLRPALKQLKALGARHIHYKVCSTFDSSPKLGSIGRVIELAAPIFPGPFVPLLVAAPALGRYTVFGTHFARFGIGSAGEVHRLDRHPSTSRHPVTPMTEADLRRHLARQTKKSLALFDILKIGLPEKEALAALKRLLALAPGVILFDALYAEHLPRIGRLLDAQASARQPLFSVGSSGVETALAAAFNSSAGHGGSPVALKSRLRLKRPAGGAGGPLLVGSGSCSPVTAAQIAWALKSGFVEVAVDVPALLAQKTAGRALDRAIEDAVKALKTGRSVILHTTRHGADRAISRRLKTRTAAVLGTALGRMLRAVLAQIVPGRLCLAGGDTASHAARALGIEAVEMIGPLTPGAPLCRAHAPGSPADGVAVVFKGGQVGAENYFGRVQEIRI